MRYFSIALLLLCSMPAVYSDDSGAPPIVYADLIISGGPIISMDPALPKLEAVAVANGRILAAGQRQQIEALRGISTRDLDLDGNTLVPGFIDGHSHFSMAVSAATWANLSGAPVGAVSNIADVVAELQAQAKLNGTAPDEWLVGYGYDADTLTDGRQMTRDDLDVAFPDVPVIAIHVSFHGAVLNSRALAAIGYDETTLTPEGGIIVRKEGTNEPLGLVMETAWFPAARALPKPEGAARLENLRLAQAFYAKSGVTTAQDGATSLKDFNFYKEAASRGELYLDLVAVGTFDSIPGFVAEQAQYQDYNGRLKLGGIKILADGSPQGKTAYFTQPYLTGGPGGEENWRGEPMMQQADMDSLVQAVYGAGMRGFIHANADAAVDMVLSAHAKHVKLAGSDPRTVIIHSQFIRPDQLEAYARYGMVPSFFSNHAFFWGDVHVENLGEERAYYLSPMKSAADLGLHFTNHNDYIVTPMDQLFTVWSAVNRVSRTGKIIGPDQRISPKQALKAITLDGAWQYGEEGSKGSISPGKLADLVVLSGNPLTVNPMLIKDIQVLATYKEGQQIYPADNQSTALFD
jgi:predicted amidohydrolase YtcJ